MCEGPSLVHGRDPGTAPPNLARVQEIAAGIWRVESRIFVDQAELWVDDIRLSDVVQETGVAGALDFAVAAADVADLAVSLSRRDGQFRQLGDDPSYVTDDAASIAGTVRVDRFLPDRWGLSIPVTARYSLAASDPFYVNRTDLRADAIVGLRTPRSSVTSFSFAARRVRPASAGLARWFLDPLSVTGSYATGGSRAELSRARASDYGLSLDYNVRPGPAMMRIVGKGIRLNPAGIRLHSGLVGADADRFTFTVPIARIGDTLPPSVSRTRLWRNSAGMDLLPVTGVQLSVDAASTRDLRDYGDSTTIGRLIRQGRSSLLGQDVGIETQRTLTTTLNLNPRVVTGIRPRALLTSAFAFTRDPNARQPVRTLGDTAGAFRVPVAFSNLRRLEAGTQIDPRRLAQSLFGDSAWVVRWLARITTVDVAFNRQRSSSFNRAGDAPGAAYQFALGGFDGFRQVEGLLAGSAVENTTVTAAGSVVLWLGLRANATYRRTRGITWALRTDEQVPIRSRTRDWPNGSISWSITPPRNNIGRVLSSLTAQVAFRRSESANEQPTFRETGTSLNKTTDRTLTPSVSLSLVGGVLLTLDGARARTEQLAAGNLFRTARDQRSAALTFAFRPPTLGRGRAPIRTTARYGLMGNTTCLRNAGQADCVPYVDSRQTQAQLTMDTDLPPNMSAGLQMAYILNEERQTNRKVAQLVITAFVQLSTSAGQIR
jgi:hypothetical protein